MLAKRKLIEAARPVSAVRTIVDPFGMLPEVCLTRNDEHFPYDHLGLDDEPTYGFWIESGRRRVGSLVLAERPGSGEYHMSDIELDTDVQGKGYGLASYLLAIETAEQDETLFVTDHKLSRDAVRVWQRLVTLDVAQQNSGFMATDPSRPYDQQKYYTADIVIDPAEL